MTKKKSKYSIPKLIRWLTPDFKDIADDIEVESLFKRTQIIANFIIMLQVLSIFVAVIALIINIRNASDQEKLANTIEKNKNAVDAVRNIHDPTFIKNYISFMEYDTMTDEMFQPFFYLLNTYYLTAVVYNSEIANKTIIQKSIESGIRSFKKRKYYKSFENDTINNHVFLEIDSMVHSFNKNHHHE